MHIKLPLLAVFIIFGISTIQYQSELKISEQDVLLDLITSIPNLAQLGWNTYNISNIACNQFIGIVCRELQDGLTAKSVITELTLQSTSEIDLTGYLPESIGNLTNLESLHLRGEGFYGNLPSSLGQLSSLIKIDIWNTKLGGSIEPLGSISTLSEINLNNNSFSGSIPASIGLLPRLREISLERNRFSGTVPESFTTATQLNYISFNYNELTGLIPNFAQLRLLTNLHLSHNQFIEGIPFELVMANVPLVVFDCSYNNLTGFVSASIGNLANLEIFDASHNQLSGTFPIGFGEIRQLRQLNLGHNKFYGPFPRTFGISEQLRRIDLSNNQFTGALADMSGLILAELFDFSSNQLTGSLPRAWPFGSLQYLSLSNNLLEGTVPVEFSQFATLRHLDLAGNSLNGCLPLFRTSMPKQCDFSYNAFNCCCHEKLPCLATTASCDTEECDSISVTPYSAIEQPTAKSGLKDFEIVLIVVLPSLALIGLGIALAIYFKRKRAKKFQRVDNTSPSVSKYGIVRGKMTAPTAIMWEPPASHKFVELDKLPLSLSKKVLTFTNQGNQFRISVPYHDSLVIQPKGKIPSSGSSKKGNNNDGIEMDFWASATEELIPHSKDSLMVNFHVPGSHKYKIACNPYTVILKKNKEATVDLTLTMLMTTDAEIPITIEIENLQLYSYLNIHAVSEPSYLIDFDEVHFDSMKPIGEGAFGAVYRGKYRGLDVAIKMLKLQDMLPEMMDEFEREISLMNKLRHSNIVQFIGASKVAGKLAILTEFVDGGSLSELVLQSNVLAPALKARIALDAAKAINFLHQNKIIHRDIKVDNLLVVSLQYLHGSCVVKLTDFGTSRAIGESWAQKFTTGVGTPIYMAPELLNKQPYDTKADVYAFGMLLWAVVSQKEPYADFKHAWDVAAAVLAGKREEIPVDCPHELKSLIERCWAQNAEDRPDMNIVVDELETYFNKLKAS